MEKKGREAAARHNMCHLCRASSERTARWESPEEPLSDSSHTLSLHLKAAGGSSDSSLARSAWDGY